ncbi:helix-turn-helix domain-containing protein [Nocardia sp. NPDC059246]|uniref:helix-turn-helix domain-containing protein n=1 Tax=unclassified Nocardia TaxID=2637762 RepID=UPI00368E47CA
MSTNHDLESQLGIDMNDPRNALARDLVEADDELLEELVRLRRASKMSQADVARAMGRDRAAVSNFEKLTADPHLSTIRRYALAIGARITHRVEPVSECKPQAAEMDIAWAAPSAAFLGSAVASVLSAAATERATRWPTSASGTVWTSSTVGMESMR